MYNILYIYLHITYELIFVICILYGILLWDLSMFCDACSTLVFICFFFVRFFFLNMFAIMYLFFLCSLYYWFVLFCSFLFVLILLLFCSSFFCSFLSLIYSWIIIRGFASDWLFSNSFFICGSWQIQQKKNKRKNQCPFTTLRSEWNWWCCLRRAPSPNQSWSECGSRQIFPSWRPSMQPPHRQCWSGCGSLGRSGLTCVDPRRQYRRSCCYRLRSPPFHSVLLVALKDR